MFVKSTMKPNHQCVIASPNDRLEKALDLLEKNDFQAMPVVEKEIFKGMISKQVIFEAFFHSSKTKEEFLAFETVGNLLTHSELFIEEDAVFERTFAVFKDFPILAVVNDKRKFLGIVSRYDALEQFESAFGIKKSGYRVAFTSIESTGRFARLADIIKHLHANIVSVTTFDESDKLARRIVLKIEDIDNIDKLNKMLEKSGFRVLDIRKL